MSRMDEGEDMKINYVIEDAEELLVCAENIKGTQAIREHHLNKPLIEVSDSVETTKLKGIHSTDYSLGNITKKDLINAMAKKCNIEIKWVD